MDFTNIVNNLLTELTNYIKGIIAAITVLMIAFYSIKYLMGDSGEKAEAITNIKRTLIMGGGVFVLIWLAGVIISRFNV